MNTDAVRSGKSRTILQPYDKADFQQLYTCIQLWVSLLIQSIKIASLLSFHEFQRFVPATEIRHPLIPRVIAS